MVMQTYLYPKPDNDVFFESFCLKVFRVYLKLPHLQKYGRRGHSQFGIDLLSDQDDGVAGIQCRLKTTSKGLVMEEIDAIIEDAKTFAPALNELIIATTADRDPFLQSHVTRITQAHKSAGLFGVVIYAWQDIEEIFKQAPELARELYAVPTIPTTTLNVASFTTINYQMPAAASHAEIDEAAQNITKGKPEIALALLEKMRRDRWEVLTPREKFRIIANIGNALLQKGDARGAALAFLEAAAHQPQDDDAALSIAAHGHLLSGNAEQAYRMTSEACARNPMNERAQIIRIQSAPKEIPYRELHDLVPEVLRANLNVALVLYERAMEENDPVEAERVLRIVKEKSPALDGALGAALLRQGLPAGIQEGMLLLPSDPDKVSEAAKYLTKVIDAGDVPTGILAGSYFNRALSFILLKDEDQAFADLRAAYEREPTNETFGTVFVAEALRRGENISALKAAEELFKHYPTPRSRLLMSTALYDLGTDEAKRRALALLQEGLADLGGLEPELRLEYLRGTLHLLDLFGALNDEAVEALEKNLKDPLENGIVRSWALLRMSRQDEAIAEAQRTAALLSEATSFPIKREVALLLSRLELAEKALPIWLEISPPRAFNDDTVHLLRSAKAIGNDNLVLDYCERLRLGGFFAPEAAGYEIELLVQYNELRAAQAVIREYLDANHQNISLRLSLLNVAVVQGWREIVEAYATSLPTPREIKTAVDGARLVQVLHFQGSVTAATEIAYELVRRFPDDPNSHRSLIVSILGPGRPQGDLNLSSPTEVVIGSAVRIRKEGEEASEWILIEDSEPEISRDEYPPDHPLAKALIGRRVGETITLPRVLVRTQTGVVEEIKNKILFRMHESLAQMNRRFPESSFFEKISIKIADEASPPTGHELDELIELSRQLAQGPMEAENLYQERRMPVAMLAECAHKEVPEVVTFLALNEKSSIHCVDGRSEEFQRVAAVLGHAREVVLDIAALSTIGLLGGDFDFSRMAAKCIVSEGTLESLRRLGKSLVDDPRVQGFLGYDEERERPRMQEIDPEMERERAARAMEFAAKIESFCEIVGGRSLARMESSTRNMLVNIFGPPTAESIAIAKQRGCPLWTDDYVTGLLIESELALQRIWTQPVCFWLRDAASMSADECDKVTARLCGLGYRFTSISWRMIIVACNLCEWNPDKQPLRGALDRFEEHAREQDMLLFTAGLIPALWREAPLIDYASRVTLRVLDKLAHNRSGLAIIRSILQRLDTLFGINVIRAQEARTVIETWLVAARSGGSIIE